MREVKNFKASESKEVLESMQSGRYTILTGERGIFEMYNRMRDDPDFKVVPDKSYRLDNSVMMMSNNFRSFKLTYKKSKIEVIISDYQDDRSCNKVLHPNGGLESSYECIMIKH